MDEIVWPKTQDEWQKFDLTKLKPGTGIPLKVETPPDKYIVDGIYRIELCPQEERHRYRLPCHQPEPEVPRNPDGTIKIIDKKQEQIDKLTKQLESLPEGKQLEKIEEQQKQIDSLTNHLITLTNQLNELTKKLNKK